MALLAVPAGLTEQAVRDCVAKGVKAAVIFSAGYAESGAEGQDIQARITEIARDGGLRLLGPNCLGVFNPQIGFFGTFTQSLDRELPPAGPLGIVSQSGAYGSHIAYLARKRGIGINYWITTGNEADIDVAESLEWMAAQPDIKVIMAYVEGVRDGPRFRRALGLARANGKPIVMMKVGRSEIGAQRRVLAHGLAGGLGRDLRCAFPPIWRASRDHDGRADRRRLCLRARHLPQGPQARRRHVVGRGGGFDFGCG